MGMAETFLTRIPTLSEGELLDYLQNPWKYKPEAVRAAVEELRLRGRIGPGEGSPEPPPVGSPLRPGSGRGFAALSPGGVRALTAGILITGLGAAAALYRRAQAPEAPWDGEPTDSKAYLRQMEMFGGKANVVASELRHGFLGLWEGKNLAFTTAFFACALALLFWLAATRRHSGT